MKLYKLFKFLLTLSFLLTTSFNLVSAAGTFETCPGIARNLSWSSSNASTNPGACVGTTGGANGFDCSFFPVPNVAGNRSVTINTLTGTCDATISCTGPGSATPISDTATLNVVNQASCCGTGSQTNQPAPYTDPSSGFRCNCPDGTYNNGANTCTPLGVTTITAVYSGLPNPSVTPSCPAPLTTVSVVRNAGPSTNLSVNANNVISDTNIVSLDSAQTYTYILTCRGTGVNSHITTTAVSAPLTIPAKVKITNPQDITSPIGENITTTWNSTGNECSIFARGPRTYVGTSYKTNAGVNASYAHSYTITPVARGELNNSHVGSNTLGYDLECIDSAQPIRGTAVDAFTAEIFKKPTATITQNGNNLTFICTPDYNKVDLKINNLSAAGYPKIYTVSPTSNFSATLAANPNSSYLLTCSYGTYSAQDARTTGPVVAVNPGDLTNPSGTNNQLNIFGAINGVAGSADTTASASTVDGRVTNLTYTLSNFDSWNIQVWANSDASGPADRSGTNTNSGSLSGSGISYIPNNLGKVNIINNTNIYNNGLYVRITATKGSISKTLNLKLVKDNSSKAKLTVISTPSPINQDLVTISLRCDNATNYNLLQNGVSIRSGPTNNNPGSFILSDITATATPAVSGGSITNYKLDCDSASDAVAFSLPSKTTAKITALLAQPTQIACPGGNDSATLKFMMSNTVGKTCRIIATKITTTSNTETESYKDNQMTALNSSSQLNSSKYKSANSDNSNKSLEQVIDDRNGSGVSGGQIVLSAAKFTSGKRLFNYSTRFTLECDSKTATPQYAPGNVTYSKKTVDMLSACVGQD